jgi:hypothetical protein
MRILKVSNEVADLYRKFTTIYGPQNNESFKLFVRDLNNLILCSTKDSLNQIEKHFREAMERQRTIQ